MTVLLALIVASKVTLLPLASSNFNVIRLPKSLSFNSVLSMLRTASLKVMVMLSLIASSSSPLAGEKVTVGAVVSGTVVLTVKGGIVSELLSFPSESMIFIVQSS